MVINLKLGNKFIKNKLVLAPMIKFSDHAFRICSLNQGAGLVYTPKYHVNALFNSFEKFASDFKFPPEEHPTVLQLIGRDIRTFKHILDKLSSFSHDFIDLNLCCPSPEAMHDEIGGFLLKQPEKIREIISTIIKYSDVPVSAKIRIGWDPISINAVKVAKILEHEGVEFLTVHGRTVTENYERENNLNVIAQVKKSVNVPIIGNGDIIDGKTAQLLQQRTRCDLLMIGRAAVGNPFIFDSIAGYLKTKREILPSKKDYHQFVFDYVHLLKKYEPNLYDNVTKLKEHLTRMLRFNLLENIKKEVISNLTNTSDLEKIIKK
ncbi:MAG: tRNA-dihydrouridine synthase family protein [Candidatus Lokiarchaeota archaeon]|nr:tRNA-dihydrouridine synthase family protein [Candidatus Lokiarchaeota archaeon]